LRLRAITATHTVTITPPIGSRTYSLPLAARSGLKLIPDSHDLLRAIPRLKEELNLNVELAAPSDFIPVPEGWEARSPLIRKEGEVSFHHFDPVAQALSKAERGHEQDLHDVKDMISNGLVDPADARAQFELIEPELYRFPAIDPASFRKSVEDLFG
jgi:hypothetical protein